MSYIATPANFHFAWYVRLLFWLQRRHYGRELEPARLWGRAPRVFLAMAAMYGALDRKASPLAYQNMSSRFNAALGVPAQGFCATARTMKARR